MPSRPNTNSPSRPSKNRGRREPLTRSEVMSRVRGKDTKPEMRVRLALYSAGLRYRLQARELAGRPDIVFRSARLAIFVHGCFWHRHPGCGHARMPKSRLDFWEAKLAGNVERDHRHEEQLRSAGWNVLTIWECETRDPARMSEIVSEVKRLVRARLGLNGTVGS
ncbi:very short patch repair endonuclease [Sphingomonas sp. DT-204]|uniref:very short patch repair endonuclease n=1 Tax=Sphingomonas sp. DT-204 TaxID=3396166 RepID=UPI003F1D35CD